MKKLTHILRIALLSATALTTAAQAGTYTLRVFAPGVKASASAPVVAQSESTGMATGSLQAMASSDFGGVWTGQAATRNFRFTNTGNAPATNVRAVTSLGGELSISANTCGVTDETTTLPAGQSCDVTVQYQPASTAALVGTLAIGGTYSNSPSSLSLSGHGVESAVGALTANTSPDFGAVALGASASRTFTFSNTGNISATGVSVALPIVTGLTMSANTCGTTSAPVSIASGSSCAITLAYGGPASSRLSGVALTVSGAFTGSPASVPLSGVVGTFDATATWSNNYTNVTPLTLADRSFGTVTTNTTSGRYIYLRNMGVNGAITTGFTLSGDTSQFKITDVQKQYPGGSPTANCTSGGVISADKLSATPCVADAPGGSYTLIRLTLVYAPTVIGNHTIAVTPITNNGTGLPGALTFTGSGEFNPSAAWSNNYTNVTALTAADLAFGTVTTNATSGRYVYLRNMGTNGAIAVGFTLSGDTSQFKITDVQRQYPGGAVNSNCNAGGAISANKLSSMPCLADVPGSSYPLIRLTLVYAPTVIGNHSITVTPTTNNGTVLPGTLTFTGGGEFNPSASWSNTYANDTAPTLADLSFGTVTTNTSNGRYVYLRNTGTNGAIAVGFNLSGDTSQFKISDVQRQYPGGAVNSSCNAGGAISADKLSSTPCLADVPGSSYPLVRLTLVYAPTVVGSHTITVTPTTNNGTVLPGTLTFTGSGAFNASASWSNTYANVTAPTLVDRSFGTVAANATSGRYVYLRNTGTNGAIAVGFTLSGDTGQFRITDVQKQYPSGAVNSSCSTGGAISADKLSSSPCLADVPGGSYPLIRLTLMYAPTASGTHNITVTPFSNNGTALPSTIAYTGTAP